MIQTPHRRARIQVHTGERIRMKPAFPRLLAGLVAAVALLAGAAPGQAQNAQPTPAEAAAYARARADSVRRPYTKADIHFMSAMIGHHAQALEMARMAPTHGASPAVRRLADRIINAQEGEIGTMQQWLRDRRQPVPAAQAHGMPHAAAPAQAAGHAHGGGHGHAHGPARASHDGHMPGMLTDAQMKELDAARGAEFDRLFLRYMIQHHRGATAMVKELFASHGAGQDETVFKFASDVNVDQETEIARMQQMLAALLFGEDSQ
jgi:uncharacterized protein (DUF305 family)